MSETKDRIGRAPLYACDAERNTKCRKTGCKKLFPDNPYAFCERTKNPAFALKDENGEPIVEGWYRVVTKEE